MEYRDMAIAAVRTAEQNLREALRPIILEAIAADAYADVASIARIAGALSDLLRQVASDTYGVDPEPGPTLEELLGSGRPASARPTSEERSAALQKHLPRGSARRDQYPCFLRDGNRLVKVAWSKKERSPYEHRAPRDVVQALTTAIQKKKGEGKLFQADDVMPLKNERHEDFPSYQSYLALNWLRDIGVISKKGREGYVLKPNAATPDAIERLWMALPTTDSHE